MVKKRCNCGGAKKKGGRRPRKVVGGFVPFGGMPMPIMSMFGKVQDMNPLKKMLPMLPF